MTIPMDTNQMLHVFVSNNYSHPIWAILRLNFGKTSYIDMKHNQVNLQSIHSLLHVFFYLPYALTLKITPKEAINLFASTLWSKWDNGTFQPSSTCDSNRPIGVPSWHWTFAAYRLPWRPCVNHPRLRPPETQSHAVVIVRVESYK